MREHPALRTGYVRALHGPVGLAAVTDADDQNDELAIVDLVDNPVVSNAQAIAVVIPLQLAGR